MELSIVSTYCMDFTEEGYQKSIYCMLCNRTSHNINDVRLKYCANCNLMHEEQRERTDADIRAAGASDELWEWAEAQTAYSRSLTARDIVLAEQQIAFNREQRLARHAEQDNINWGRDGF